MKIYSVHAPTTGAGPERAHFERQGFSWPAFLFGPFWLAWRRLWRVLAAWCVAAVLIGLGVGFGGLTGGAAAGLFFIIQLYLGIEGCGLADVALERSGWRLSDVAAGADRIEAERSYFARRAQATPPAPYQRGVVAPPATPSVIGLFPETGG
ncbi:MAG TPA: DUF2628 domain-containing protein [Roseiarcus sp.]|nr:DUF2628 domain-containing protein [Roseiarcus sp.]